MKLKFYAKKSIAALRRLRSAFIGYKTKPFVYISIGDSTVEGIGATKPEKSYAALIHKYLLSKNRHTIYYNLGEAYATTEDVIHLQLQKTIALQPDLVTISVGPNDIRIKTPVKIFRIQLKSLFSELKNKSNAQIVINTIPDFSLTTALPAHKKTISKILAYRMNKIIKEESIAASVIVVDIYDMSKTFASNPEILSEDGFHPSDAGYAVWADAFINQIKYLYH